MAGVVGRPKYCFTSGACAQGLLLHPLSVSAHCCPMSRPSASTNTKIPRRIVMIPIIKETEGSKKAISRAAMTKRRMLMPNSKRAFSVTIAGRVLAPKFG